MQARRRFGPLDQRGVLDEAVAAVAPLLRDDEPLTAQTSWFRPVEARARLEPGPDGGPEIGVASTTSPTGAALAAAGRRASARREELFARQAQATEETTARYGARH